MHHPGNIKAVRISILARTQTPESGMGRTLTLGRLENRAAFNLVDAMPDAYVPLFPAGQLRTEYRYMVLQTTASPPNLSANGLFMF
jgi:hypothetical protein